MKKVADIFSWLVGLFLLALYIEICYQIVSLFNQRITLISIGLFTSVVLYLTFINIARR